MPDDSPSLDLHHLTMTIMPVGTKRSDMPPPSETTLILTDWDPVQESRFSTPVNAAARGGAV
jgi:hypothetical protein